MSTQIKRSPGACALTAVSRARSQEDEKRLASECELLGPLIGFPGPGKRGHCTVAKLARAIVAGSVRRTCEARLAEIQVRLIARSHARRPCLQCSDCAVPSPCWICLRWPMLQGLSRTYCMVTQSAVPMFSSQLAGARLQCDVPMTTCCFQPAPVLLSCLCAAAALSPFRRGAYLMHCMCGSVQELKAQLAEAAAASDARAARLEAETAALRRELAARR